MDFRVPFDDEEALAISGVLDTCQDEISKLMLKRRRIIEQKKYLLKNLITGTIRTPEDLKPLDTTRLERSAL